MMMVALMGGCYILENPVNSLVAMHPRYVWMVERLLRFGVPVPLSLQSHTGGGISQLFWKAVRRTCESSPCMCS